jgi:dienelactone hydrolase
MSDLLRIQPTRTSLADMDVLEITLGGVPRGLVILLLDETATGHEAEETMNHLAEHGYETLCTLSPSFDPLLARALARGWTTEQTAVVGVGPFGGRVALAAAVSTQLAAVVSLSPALDLDATNVRSPWLGLFGERDVTPAEVSALAARLYASSDIFTQVVRYPGVGRDFYRRTSDGVAYAASYDGWQRVLEWLDARVAPRLTPLAQAWREHKGAVLREP